MAKLGMEVAAAEPDTPSRSSTYVARPVIGEVGPTSTDATVALERTWLGGAAGAAWLF